MKQNTVLNMQARTTADACEFDAMIGDWLVIGTGAIAGAWSMTITRDSTPLPVLNMIPNMQIQIGLTTGRYRIDVTPALGAGESWIGAVQFQPSVPG